MNFESQQIRSAALGLLNLGKPISRKTGGFLGQLAAQPDPISPKQRKWLDDLLATAGIDPVEETIVRPPQGWNTLVFVTPEWAEEDDLYRVVLMKATAIPEFEVLLTFPLDEQGEEEAIAWARDYALQTPGCVFGGPDA